VRWTATGTYAGGLGFVGVNDALAVGRTVTLKGIDILRIERGKIAERWGQFDGLGMVRQLTP
jgi:predicted ester cyclase